MTGEESRGRRPAGVPVLHLVTDDRVLGHSSFASRAAEALGAGGHSVALHLRGPETSGRRLHELARSLGPVARDAGAMLLVNDRVDVARAAEIDGVHLGERSLPIPVARRLLPDEAVLGRSVHGPDGAASVSEDSPTFLIAGTVFATRSHPGRPGAGPDLIFRVVQVTDLPVVAIGGITPERVEVLVRRGGHGVAVLRGVWDTRHPAVAVERYLSSLEAAGAAREGEPPEASEADGSARAPDTQEEST